MGSVVSLKAFRSSKPKVKFRTSTEADEFTLLSEGLISQWRYNEVHNNLNSFIAAKLQIEEQDFVNDRNEVAALEDDTGLVFCVYSPSFTDDNLIGWQAGFAMNERVYLSIPLSCETKARLYCVLLYHALMEAASSQVANAHV